MSTGLCGSEPYIAPEQFMGKRKTQSPTLTANMCLCLLSLSHLAYDARLVDIWACGVVYYCLLFQELPWRAAQTSEPLFAAYRSTCASHPWREPSAPPPTVLPTTITNISPRAARTLLRRILEPDPQLRCTIQEVMQHPWLQSIEVCTEGKHPKHQHSNVRAALHQPVVVGS